MRRRRINSERGMVASYNCGDDRVHIGHERCNSELVNYENDEAIQAHQLTNTVGNSSSYPRRSTTSNQVRYDPRAQHVEMSMSPRLNNPSSTTKPQSGGGASRISRSSSDAHPHNRVHISSVSLRSDCEPLLTPGSNSTSGIGSLNLSNSNVPHHHQQHPPTSLLAGDPWQKRTNITNQNLNNHSVPNHRFNFMQHHHRMSPSYPAPHSAREYVNTFNASMDVGTPLPATATVGGHFNFDFDLSSLPHRPRSSGSDRVKLNYVPIEVFKNTGDDFSCGASSASSGIPGTPRTPKTPLGSHQATDYAIIDHNKTQALSKTQRQRERKSRHESSETSTLVNGI